MISEELLRNLKNLNTFIVQEVQSRNFKPDENIKITEFNYAAQNQGTKTRGNEVEEER